MPHITVPYEKLQEDFVKVSLERTGSLKGYANWYSIGIPARDMLDFYVAKKHMEGMLEGQYDLPLVFTIAAQNETPIRPRVTETVSYKLGPVSRPETLGIITE
ncbi:MAG: hypothetical protein KJ922_06190, partial [Nanoarchaeota archaeon]|nr:hypothetical protein [Nanoarchaeota archaeon]